MTPAALIKVQMKQGKRRLPWDRFDELMRRRTRRTPGPA